MWKLTASLMFLEGGCIAEVFGDYTPDMGSFENYPPKVLRRVFVSREEAAIWIADEVKGFRTYIKELTAPHRVYGDGGIQPTVN